VFPLSFPAFEEVFNLLCETGVGLTGTVLCVFTQKEAAVLGSPEFNLFAIYSGGT